MFEIKIPARRKNASRKAKIYDLIYRQKLIVELIAPVKTRDTVWMGAVCHRFRISDTVPVPVYPVT